MANFCTIIFSCRGLPKKIKNNKIKDQSKMENEGIICI